METHAARHLENPAQSEQTGSPRLEYLMQILVAHKQPSNKYATITETRKAQR